jgi:hypothetical protein
MALAVAFRRTPVSVKDRQRVCFWERSTVLGAARIKRSQRAAALIRELMRFEP